MFFFKKVRKLRTRMALIWNGHTRPYAFLGKASLVHAIIGSRRPCIFCGKRRIPTFPSKKRSR